MSKVSLDIEKSRLLFDILVHVIPHIVLKISTHYQNGRESPVSTLKISNIRCLQLEQRFIPRRFISYNLVSYKCVSYIQSALYFHAEEHL